jgi:hypothetical protein
VPSSRRLTAGFFRAARFFAYLGLEPTVQGAGLDPLLLLTLVTERMLCGLSGAGFSNVLAHYPRNQGLETFRRGMAELKSLWDTAFAAAPGARGMYTRFMRTADRINVVVQLRCMVLRRRAAVEFPTLGDFRTFLARIAVG